MILMNMMMTILQRQLPFSRSLFNLSKVISHQWPNLDFHQFQGHQECLQVIDSLKFHNEDLIGMMQLLLLLFNFQY